MKNITRFKEITELGNSIVTFLEKKQLYIKVGELDCGKLGVHYKAELDIEGEYYVIDGGFLAESTTGEGPSPIASVVELFKNLAGCIILSERTPAPGWVKIALPFFEVVDPDKLDELTQRMVRV